MLPEAGSVLGVDVGWSLTSATNAICRLDWTSDRFSWTIERFTARADDIARAFALVVDRPALVAAFDGPLRGDLAEIGRYRVAEARLSKGLVYATIGKAAQSSSGNGRKLNVAANQCATALLAQGLLGGAVHSHAIHFQAITEAFPNSFLGLMLTDPAPHKGGRGSRSDRYYLALVADGTLEKLIAYFLPGRKSHQSLLSVTNHDDRAALVCALTALCVANNDYTAVGDEDGWIILPPRALIAPWAQPIVDAWNHGTQSGLSR